MDLPVCLTIRCDLRRMGGFGDDLKNVSAAKPRQATQFGRDCKIALAWPYQGYLMRAVSRENTGRGPSN